MIDGHAQAYRSFYAIRTLTSPSGEPVQGIYGFIKAFDRFLQSHRPELIGVVWDGGLDEDRVRLHVSYKAQRPPMPPDLERQILLIQSWLDARGVWQRRKEGVEADDIIASLTQTCVSAVDAVLIASPDKDFMQLVSPTVRLIGFGGSTTSGFEWGPLEVKEKTGVEPTQIVDWLSLIGDSVDNVPGVSGVGPKRASELLNEFGSIDALYEMIEAVRSPRIRASLIEGKEVVMRNRDLIRLRTDRADGVGWDALRVRPFDSSRLAEMYRHWGFKSMLERLASPQGRQTEMF